MVKTKYNSKKEVFNGIKFDSHDELLYFKHLMDQVERKEIKSFELQPLYTLIDKFEKDGVKYRAITSRPDFKVYHNDGGVELIDVKGMSTQQGNLRRKLFDARYSEKLTWVTRNLKHGDEHGWIEYDQLAKVRAKQKKAKASDDKE